MNFPWSYFEDEVRDGFYVDGLMKKCWAAQIEVLEEVAKVCEKHNIKWFADCGTLIGAIRHGGFVPWDDDLDICMLRDEYNRFLSVAKKELPSKYCVLNLHTDEQYTELLTRITNGSSICFEKDHLDKYHGFPFVAGIDIFPLDYVAKNAEEEAVRKNLIHIVSGIQENITDENQCEPEAIEYLKQIEQMCKVELDYSKSMKKQLALVLDDLYSLYTSDNSDEVVLMPYWCKEDSHLYPKEYFLKSIDVPFETGTIKVPAAYDGVLQIEYGDYMRESRAGGVHDYPYYEEQEQQLERLIGKLPYKYTFSKDDINNEGRHMRITPKQQITSILELIKEEHAQITAHIENASQVLPLLEECQNAAIQIGTQIEQSEGENFVTIGYIEQYCEYIYNVHTAISQGDIQTAAALDQEMNESLNRICDSVEKDIHVRKEIVFLPYKAAMWDSLESVWKAANDDPDCDAYVIPIPYYDKNSDGTFRELHYEGEQFPDYVPVISYDNYDFEGRHPDEIYIHNPYDECNFVTSVHPFFYSKNLKKFTDKLIYIPYFVLDEINPEDEKAVKSMEHFATVPGVIQADVTIVQSEAMRKAYIEALTKFAGEDTRPIWEKKILGTGSPKFDKVQNSKKSDYDLPKEWLDIIVKPDGTDKKIIMYNTSVSTLLQYKDKTLDKIERAFSVFEKNKDNVALLWRPHPLIKDTIQSLHPELLEKYEEIVNNYREQGWGIYDDSPDLNRAIAVCDAYYGDPSSIVQLCKRAGKPIMLENVDI